MLVAIFLILASCIPMVFLDEETQMYIYPLAIVQGIGLIILLNTSTSLISDVIGNDSDSAAFVYGIYSFFDKISNGIVLEIVITLYSTDETGLRYVIAGTPIVTSVLAFVLTYIGAKFFSNKLAKITGIKSSIKQSMKQSLNHASLRGRSWRIEEIEMN